MRGAPSTMKVLAPKSVEEALRLYARQPRAVPLAGGTDFMVVWNTGTANGRTVIDLSRLREWSGIKVSKDKVVIGALTPHAVIRDHADIQAKLPLLSQACATVGGLQIQNRGTIGGNLANASPAGDTFPPLSVYEAVVHAASARGKRRIPLSGFFAGVKKTVLAEGELIEAVEVPIPPKPTRQFFRKVGTRAASAISKTVAAGLLWLDKGVVVDVRLALGSMAPTVRRLQAVETFLAGKQPAGPVIDKAVDMLVEDVSPIDDIRSTADYRINVSRNLIRRFLEASS